MPALRGVCALVSVSVISFSLLACRNNTVQRQTRNIQRSNPAEVITGGVAIAPSGSMQSVQGLNSSYSFSASFQGPASKQGVFDARSQGHMTSTEFDQRYSKLKNMGTAYRQYNMFWSYFEDSGLLSSVNPRSCSAGYQMFPANESERLALGYHRYHCFNLSALARFDNLFQRDQAAGMQSGVVLWSAPSLYRYVDCQGFEFGGNYLKDGCVPRDDAMDDFEDYINLIASRYNGGNHGKISHFIVWNENASPDWFDYSPIASRNDSSAASVEKRIDKYADMLKRVHAALVRHQQRALLYASTDSVWEPNAVLPGHFGTHRLLDGLWARLGIQYSWSVAVHPYGDVEQMPSNGYYGFKNLEMVVNHQAQMLQSMGISDPEAYPQTLLIASEQGWPLPTARGIEGALGRESQARQVCLAHDKVMSMNQVVAVAHNYFHSTEPAENELNGTSGQGSFFALLPYGVPNNLDGFEKIGTGKAYISTSNPNNWKQRDDHYCCQLYGVGCRAANPNRIPTVEETHQVKGVIDGISVINNQNMISGWACMHAMDQSIPIHLYVGGAAGSGQFVGEFSSNLESEGAVASSCGAGGSYYRFRIPVTQQMSTDYGGQLLYIHGISPLGLGNHLLNRSGTLRIPSLVTSSGVCTPNSTRTCAISNGSGSQSCSADGMSWGTACSLVACNSGYSPLNNGCVVTPQAPVSLGFVDEVLGSNVRGWACLKGQETSVQVSVYAGGPAGSGALIATGTANGARESAVGVACNTSGSAHGYSVPLSSALMSQYAGKAIYVYLVSGGMASPLAQSGVFFLPSATAPIYEFFNGTDYFETAVYSEGIGAGYQDRGVAFRVYGSPGAGLIPVYRCYIASIGDHFVSPASNCEGMNYESRYGYIFASPTQGHVALYRYRNPSTGDHLASIGGAPLGYSLEGILGYVPQ